MSKLLKQQLAPTHLEIVDDSQQHVGHAGAASGAGHFSIHISSPHFAGKTRINQHRLVYDALASMMPADIHALIIHVISAKDCGF